MAYRWLTGLPTALSKWGVNWVGVDGYTSRAAQHPPARNFTPVGVINHHTAGTNWYPVDRLLKKCNLYIDPSGLVHVISLGYQYDTGYVDARVLSDMQAGVAPRPSADYKTSDRILGNEWFIDIEVGHWGLGQPIPDVQRESLILANAAIIDMQRWNPYVNLNDHKGVTKRKIDVNWFVPGRGVDRIEWIRKDTAAVLAAGNGADVHIDIEDATIAQWYEDGHIRGDPALLPEYFFEAGAANDDERIDMVNSVFRSISAASVKTAPVWPPEFESVLVLKAPTE